jgi:hypothetical protein
MQVAVTSPVLSHLSDSYSDSCASFDNILDPKYGHLWSFRHSADVEFGWNFYGLRAEKVAEGLFPLIRPATTIVPGERRDAPFRLARNRHPCDPFAHASGRDSEVSTLKQTAIKRAVLLLVSATGLVVSVAIAQTPSEDKDVIPPRSINLTAEQSYIIKEIVLTETRAEQAPPNAETKIGDKVPDDVKLQSFPKLVAEKVPQVKTYKFFVIQNQVVVVSPQDNVVADIIK